MVPPCGNRDTAPPEEQQSGVIFWYMGQWRGGLGWGTIFNLPEGMASRNKNTISGRHRISDLLESPGSQSRKQIR